MSPTRAKYFQRMEKKCPAEVAKAYRDGTLSARSARQLITLSATEQLAFLHRREGRKRAQAQRCKQVAEIIASYLSTCPDKPNLERLRVLLESNVFEHFSNRHPPG
jgi:hypothetical protein